MDYVFRAFHEEPQILRRELLNRNNYTDHEVGWMYINKYANFMVTIPNFNTLWYGLFKDVAVNIFIEELIGFVPSIHLGDKIILSLLLSDQIDFYQAVEYFINYKPDELAIKIRKLRNGTGLVEIAKLCLAYSCYKNLQKYRIDLIEFTNSNDEIKDILSTVFCAELFIDSHNLFWWFAQYCKPILMIQFATTRTNDMNKLVSMYEMIQEATNENDLFILYLSGSIMEGNVQILSKTIAIIVSASNISIYSLFRKVLLDTEYESYNIIGILPAFEEFGLNVEIMSRISKHITNPVLSSYLKNRENIEL